MEADIAMQELKKRLYGAVVALLFVVIIGAAGYFYLGGGLWSVADCIYMTIITLSTVGYGETLSGMHAVPYARAWTVGLILLGSGTLLYAISTFTAVIIEGDLRGVLRRKRMQNDIDKLKGHVIVCGAGTTGVHAIHELQLTRAKFVIVDRDEKRFDELRAQHGDGLVCLAGEAHADTTLLRAGIERASGILIMLHDDRDNLYVTLTARALNPGIRIVSKAVEHHAVSKLMRAGANRVVSPAYIGGMRLASEVIRPHVVEFLDGMMRGDEQLRIEDVAIPKGSSLEGSMLRETNIRTATDALVVAIRSGTGEYHFNPKPSTILDAGATLVVLAHVNDVEKLRGGLASGSIGRA